MIIIITGFGTLYLSNNEKFVGYFSQVISIIILRILFMEKENSIKKMEEL